MADDPNPKPAEPPKEPAKAEDSPKEVDLAEVVRQITTLHPKVEKL